MKTYIYLLPFFLIFCFSCQNKSSDQSKESMEETVNWEKPRVPEWHKDAVIYEVNLRQHTQEGTFQAFEKDLPRLRDLGVDILWLMPIHEISKTNRKEGLGSPYAVNNYKEVNPDFGTMADFEQLVKSIHDAGMHVIIDWVPNHTGWDNPWITEHPEWYTKNAAGEITDPLNPDTGSSWGWTDVADLDYSNQEMRLAMIDAMAFWIEDKNIDGFRVDVAHGVPADFWTQTTDSLYAIKPIFMFAEAEIPALVNSGDFVMDYGWEMHHLLNDIAKYQGANQKESAKLVKGNLQEGGANALNKKTAADIDTLLAKKKQDYQKGYQMQFTSNHDENAWAGTPQQRIGNGDKAFAVLTATFDGMPLLYSGMESKNPKQLNFFEKDDIDWGNYEYSDFYKTLFALKHKNKALWNGEFGGELQKINTGNDENIYAFSREKDGDKVIVIINLSSKNQSVQMNLKPHIGEYVDVFSNEKINVETTMDFTLEPWAYKVYSNR